MRRMPGLLKDATQGNPQCAPVEQRKRVSMTLVACRECGKEVSDTASACPGCGAPVAKPASQAIAAGSKKEAKPGPMRLLVTAAILVGIVFVGVKVLTGSSVRSAVTGPEVIAKETVPIDEGEARAHCVDLPTRRRVQVQVSATPEKVSIILLPGTEWEKYSKARGRLLGGKYSYNTALSQAGTISMDKEAMLEAGRWCIAVERPRESLVFTDQTIANITIIAH